MLYRKFPCDISIYICIITQIGSSPLFFSFYLSPFLMVISTGLKILNSFLYRKYINHIHLPYPPFLVSAFPLVQSVFLFFWWYWVWLMVSQLLGSCSTTWATAPFLASHSCSLLFKCLFIVHWNFCLGIIHALYFSQQNPSLLYSLASPPFCSI
jgi:hypothetical protein